MQTVVDTYVVEDTGLPTHLPICVEFSLPESKQLVDVVHRPMAIPLDFACPNEEDERHFALAVAQRILSSSRELWERAVASANVEALWLQWSKDAERYLLDRGACITTCRKTCYQGRGVVSIHRKQARVATQQPDSGAVPLHTRRLLKLVRRLEDLVRRMHRSMDHVGPSGLERQGAKKYLAFPPCCSDSETNPHAPHHAHVTCEHSTVPSFACCFWLHTKTLD